MNQAAGRILLQTLTLEHAGCLPFIKKFRKFWLGIFHRQERYVSFLICLKFPDCRAALDWMLVTT